MDVTLWTLVIVLASLAELLVGLLFVPGFMPNRTQAFSEAVGIRLVPELQQMVTRRLTSRYAGIAIGANVGLIAGTLLVLSRAAGDGYLSWFIIVGSLVVGIALGAAISSVVGRSSVDPDAVKYARVRTVTLPDYVPPIELWTARVSVLLSLIALAVGVVLGFDLALPAALALLGLGGLVFFEVAGRRIVAQPQPAGSPRELGWEDALRASVLRDMSIAPLALGVFSLLLVLVTILGALQPISLLVVIGLTVISRLSARSRPQRHFLRRLWADPA